MFTNATTDGPSAASPSLSSYADVIALAIITLILGVMEAGVPCVL